MINYSVFDLLLNFTVYAFLGWVIEVCYYSIKTKTFVNRGFINLPFSISSGIIADLLFIILPTLKNNIVLQYIAIFVVLMILNNLTNFVSHRISKLDANEWKEGKLLDGMRSIYLLIFSAIFLLIYKIIHPVLFGGILLIPAFITKIIVYTLIAFILIDLFATIFTMRTGHKQDINENNLAKTKKLAYKIKNIIWKRLEKAYPGIENQTSQKSGKYIFAEGMCLDKLIWVFLVSAFLGDFIEMAYCRVVGGSWMNRSSVLYGTFSFVWGIGAVLLTVVLRKVADKPDRVIFAAGFVIGGAYEYLCSVFTELVFGTVFWDYSHMPLNIGGRTNIWYCFAWGILAVVWIKIIYPPMSRNIEKLPALTAKVFTWIVTLVMIFNGLLTTAAMIRYSSRQEQPVAQNFIDEFIDENFNDQYMESRWPNMVQV